MSFRNFQITEEKDPRGLVPVAHPQPHICPVAPERLKGKWYRAMPRTPREIAFVQSLELHTDKFSPSSGHGVLISEAAFNWLAERSALASP